MGSRIQAVWAGRVRVEHASAATTAHVLHLLILAGAPDPLLATAQRIVRDELDHAALSYETWLAYGGSGEPVDAPPVVPPPVAEVADILPVLLAGVLRSFCFGETLAVPFFSAMHRTAVGPAQQTLSRIVADEAVHARFGWEALDWLRSIGGAAMERGIADLVPGVIADLEGQYAANPSGQITEAEAAAGLLSGRDFHDLFRRTVERTILPRLRDRGVPI